MFESIKQIIILLFKSKKAWIIPVLLAFLIVGLVIAIAQTSPLPMFIYPII